MNQFFNCILFCCLCFLEICNCTVETKPLPKLIIFDLDFTLWPFWMDTMVVRPVQKRADGDIYDAKGHKIEHYPDSVLVLEHVKSMGIPMAVASRTSHIATANELLRLLDWDKYFKYKQIYPERKILHLAEFRNASGVPFSEMLFFDDEYRNIHDVNQINVTTFTVMDGMNFEVLERAFRRFAERKTNKAHTVVNNNLDLSL